MDVLNKCVSVASERVGSRAIKSGANERNKDGSVQFKVGCIMNHVGKIEGTSEAMASFVKKHTQPQKAVALTAATNAAATYAAATHAAATHAASKAAKDKESNEALALRLNAAETKISMHAVKKNYAQARLKMAKLLKDDVMVSRIKLILQTKGAELKRLVVELVHGEAAAM